MFTLVLPCAGRSTRFPDMRPKWSLTHPNGKMMITQGISGLDLSNFSSIKMSVLKSDVDKYNLINAIYKSFEEFKIDFELLILDEPTSSQSETISLMITQMNIEGEIYIKDCDDFFVFSDSIEFVETYNKIKNRVDGEIYVSHVIYEMLLNDKSFKIQEVKNYEDWGTLKDWENYKLQYKTLFIDLDGVIVHNSAELFEPIWGTTDGIKKNVEYLNSMYDSGKVRIIITTSRKSSFKDATIKQLKKVGLRYHDIIFDLMHCKRYLINDFSSSNSYPSSISVNLERNSNRLEEFLK